MRKSNFIFTFGLLFFISLYGNFIFNNHLFNVIDNAENINQVKFEPRSAASKSELNFSTLLGGIDMDYLTGMAVDDEGYIYITGKTYSEDFPTTPDAFQDDLRDLGGDIYVSKISPDGSTLVYSTYIGGYDSDYGGQIEVDNSGCAYVTGFTYSTHFPTTSATAKRRAGHARHYLAPGFTPGVPSL